MLKSKLQPFYTLKKKYHSSYCFCLNKEKFQIFLYGFMLKITLYGTLSSANHFDAKERQRRVINGVGDMKKIHENACIRNSYYLYLHKSYISECFRFKKRICTTKYDIQYIHVVLNNSQRRSYDWKIDWKFNFKKWTMNN